MLPIPSRTLGALLGVAAVALLLHLLLRSEREKGRLQCETQHSQAASEAVAKARAEDYRRAAEAGRIGGDTLRAADRARAAADRLDAAAAGLRDAIAARLRDRAAPEDPAAAPAAPPAASQPDLLADVLGEAGTRLRALAREADARGAPGSGCERQYDSLEQLTQGEPQ